MKREFYRFILSILILSQTGILFSQNGHPLDFFEDWSSGSFDTNFWTTESENWVINGAFGNPAPAAEFNWDPLQINYNIGLESYPLAADSLFAGRIYLDFDIQLDEYLATGTEKLAVGIWNWESQEWTAIDSFSNANGSFGWLPVHLDISDQALGKVFKIKFSAKGEASLNILSWYIDNIHVYRECDAPFDLELEVMAPWETFKLTWAYPPGSDNQWIQWDDGVNYTSIGTVGPLEFDVTARWEPDQLKNYPGAILKQVSFFPAESISTYSIRVWTGEAAQNVVVDQPVNDPAIDQWNFINLNTPLPVDTSQVLWIGYHMNSVFGYPAGVDNGPAVNGYGNMINHYGWKTLLQLNPDLDYNFNIEAFIEFTDTNDFPQSFDIYRSDDGGPWFLRDTSGVQSYLDDSVCMTTGKLAFQYKVKALCIEGNDTCESDYSNEVMEVCEGVYEDENDFNLRIYPNPSRGLIHIEIRDDISFEKSERDAISNAKLLNSKGDIFWEDEINAGSFILPVVNYPEGMYLLRVETGKGVVSRKVVIMR